MKSNFLVACVVLMLLGAVAWFIVSRPQNEAQAVAVKYGLEQRQDGGYVTSNQCARCHPDQHSSWHASFHRKMTQAASPETVVAPFDDIQLNTDGQTAKLFRRGDEFWVNTVDQGWEQEKFTEWTQSRGNGDDPFANLDPESVPRVDAEVLMTTGSHHFQAFWLKGKEGRELWQFPWRWNIAEKRWVHRKDVFLTPPEWRPGMWFRVWNKQCIYCHSTGPYPGQDVETGVMADTKIAELGISCEACHGPAEQHIAFHDDANNAGLKSDPIVNPAELDHQKSSQVCGSCHSHFQHNDAELAVHGPQFRPGDDLFKFGSFEPPPQGPVVMSRYWGDGANRSGGREFSGMSSSACFIKGELACTSCHSMHSSDPNDQLARDAIGNAACLQCHEQFAEEATLTAHTNHAASSSGSECYNCHMPHTNYALFKAIRSHRIDSPRVSSVTSNSRPNACNLCHLDQTQQWTAQHLDEWYGIKSPALSFDDKYISAGLLWALKGDAGQRVIAAWHFGWDKAREASGSQWMVPTIVELMKDPYAAVRWVAFDALRSDKRFGEVEFEFDEAAEARDAVAGDVLELWLAEEAKSAREKITPEQAARILFKSDGLPDVEQMQRVLADRDQRLVAGVE